MVLPVTTIATIILAAWYVVLTMRVIDARRMAGVSLGDGGDERLTRRMRGQSNFVENVPIVLLLMAVTEMQTVSALPDFFQTAFALAATIFVLGRFLHGYAFCFTDHWMFGRLYGMIATFIAQIVLVFLALFAVLA